MVNFLEEKENGVRIRGGRISLWPQKQHFLAEGRMGTMMQRTVILFFGGWGVDREIGVEKAGG